MLRLLKENEGRVLLTLVSEQQLYRQATVKMAEQSKAADSTLRHVTLHRTPERPYGMRLLASQDQPAPVFVDCVKEDGAAMLSGQIRAGDRIMSINGTSTAMTTEGATRGAADHLGKEN